MTTSPQPYLSGLRLSGRRVVVLGGGAVAQRRLSGLLDSGAQIELISPAVTPAIQRMATKGQVAWTQRNYRAGDLAKAWYVLVATDDETCNRAASVEAEAAQIFCVRADRAADATAWTPATGAVDGLQIGVLAAGDHSRSQQIRDLLLHTIRLIGRRAA